MSDVAERLVDLRGDTSLILRRFRDHHYGVQFLGIVIVNLDLKRGQKVSVEEGSLTGTCTCADLR